MATFYENPNYDQPKEYLNWSKEPDRIRSDESMSKLFGNIGEGIISGIGVVYDATNRNIRDTLTEGFDKVIAEHGGDLAPEEVPAISGKGGRGSKFSAVNEDGTASEDTLGQDEVPASLRSRISGLERMKTARDAGKLSESHFNASLLSVVKEVRSQYPMYREEIDKMTKEITGRDPANALRSSVLADMNSAAAAANAQDRQNQQWYQRDQAILGMLYPNASKEWLIANRDRIEPEIAKTKGINFAIEAQEKRLGLLNKIEDKDRSDANRAFSQRAQAVVSAFFTGAQNAAGVNVPDFQRRVQSSVASGKIPTPEEMSRLTAEGQTIKLAISQELDNIANRRLSANSTKSYASIMDPKELEARKSMALSQIDTVLAAIGTKDPTLAGRAVTTVAGMANYDAAQLMYKSPSTRILAGYREAIKDPGTFGMVVQSTNLIPNITREVSTIITNNAQANLDPTGPRVTITDQINGHKVGPEDKVPGAVQKAIVDVNRTLTGSTDEGVAGRAAQALYDQTYFAGLPNKDKEKVFTLLGSKQMTDRMKKLGQSQPEIWTQYSQWMERAFVPVFKTAVDDLEQMRDSGRYNINVDPKSLTIIAETKPEFRERLSGGAIDRTKADPAIAMVGRLNQAISLIKPVLDQTYGSAAAPIRNMMIEMGWQPDAPPSPGILDSIGRSIGSSLSDFGSRWGASEGKIGSPSRVEPGVDPNLSTDDYNATVDEQSVSRVVRGLIEQGWEPSLDYENFRRSSNVEDERVMSIDDVFRLWVESERGAEKGSVDFWSGLKIDNEFTKAMKDYWKRTKGKVTT